MNLGAGVHLTYCSNIHPGESWPEVRANLETHVRGVRDLVAVPGEFGVGLRLSALAAEALAQPAELAELRDFLRRERMYVFTINGFPYGTFHGARVKEEVYLPDWRDPERLRYSDLLADLLVQLLPEDPSIEGSLSTVPGAYKAAVRGPADVELMVEHLLRHVAHLVALRERTGRKVVLALEPEPCCFLETIDEVVDFFERELFGAGAARRLATLTGLQVSAAETALRTHVGICLDLCHAAVEFEDPDAMLQRLRHAGIRVAKMQVSSGLRVPVVDAPSVEALAGFGDPVYLHQVVQRDHGGLRRFSDLPDAFAAFGRQDMTVPAEWRVHFHVPIFLDRLGPFRSTQDVVREVLARQRVEPVSLHLEVETYTWDVLPQQYRTGSVIEAVNRELQWVRRELNA